MDNEKKLRKPYEDDHVYEPVRWMAGWLGRYRGGSGR